jgi:peptidoglycan/LPS O-acetylase OafA/YrhL
VTVPGLAIRVGDSGPEAPFRLGHRASLDGLRGIAILVVMFFHAHLFKYGRGGFLGVDIFFVLSGFLITCLLAQEWDETGNLRLRSFYARRFLRLFPALAVVVLVTGAWYAHRPPVPEGFGPVASHLVSVLVYVSDFDIGHRVLEWTWSLSIEEQFYLIWPLSFLLVLRAGLTRTQILAVVGGAVIAVTCHRAALYLSRTWPTTWPEREVMIFRLYMKPDCRLDAPLIGCLAGLLASWRLAPRIGRDVVVVPVAGLAFAICIAPIDWPWLYLGGFTLVALAAAVVLLHTVQNETGIFGRWLGLPGLTWIGRLSYSLYLWHYLVYLSYDHLFGQPSVRSYTLRIGLPFLGKVAGSFAVAAASYYLVERPFLRVKVRFAVVHDRSESCLSDSRANMPPAAEVQGVAAACEA